MNRNKQTVFRVVVINVLFCLFAAVATYAGEYDGLVGVREIKAVFDVRTDNLKYAAISLDLINQTYHDESIRKISEHPEFVVVFVGPAVKLISTATKVKSDDEKVLLRRITDTVAKMAKDGIKLEACLFAAKHLGVDPTTLLPEVKQVGNGWISLIGYQANGYSLVAVY